MWADDFDGISTVTCVGADRRTSRTQPASCQWRCARERARPPSRSTCSWRSLCAAPRPATGCWPGEHTYCWPGEHTHCWQGEHIHCWLGELTYCWQGEHIRCWPGEHTYIHTQLKSAGDVTLYNFLLDIATFTKFLVTKNIWHLNILSIP